MEQLYPPGPSNVPKDLTKPTRIYQRRAWLAMGGLLLFVVLYLLLSGWFAWTAYELITGALDGGNKAIWGGLVGICAAFLAVMLLKALFFVRHGQQSDDIEITAAEQPRLFSFLHRLADEAGAPRPHRVFLSPRVNAAVFYDLSLLNLIFPSKKNLEIGLALVNVLTLDELKAVLAHEFGHFAQRSMAVGRWVYVAQQIAGHIVSKRDVLDSFLEGLSRVDLRVAWIGWVLRLIVWSIRSLVEAVFNLVVIMQRALSREMEMNADLVAVSLTGSDSLIHALHRLQAADDAWDRAVSFVNTELAAGRATQDVLAIQSRLILLLAAIYGDASYGKTPVPPASNPEAHRVFQAALALPPRMWSTHPHNHEREQNAKRVYVAAPRDARSGWLLFDDAAGLRARMTAQFTRGAEDAKPVPVEESIKTLDGQFNREALRQRYRGVYIGRSPVLHARSAAELYAAPMAAAAKELAALYPASLADDLERLRNVEKELGLLQAVRDGIYEAAEGKVRLRGKALARRELPAAIESLKKEVDDLQDKVHAHDQRVRTAHRAAAAQLQHGWEPYLVGLAQVLHYAAHAEADVRDAQGMLSNVVAVATATRKVSADGIARVVNAAGKLHAALSTVFAQGDQVVPDVTLLQRLEAKSWQEALGEFKLSAPAKDNIGDWLNVADSWVNQAAGALAALRSQALEQLLISEAALARHVQAGSVPEQAPAPSKVPADYPTLVPGEERKRVRKLGGWARFQTADGLIPGMARLAVAGSIIVAVLTFGSTIGTATVVVYNGLARSLNVVIGQHSAQVPAFGSTQIDVPPSKQYKVMATTLEGKPVDSFEVDLSGGFSTYLYNIASASPLVEWTAVYGNVTARPDRMLGTPRWSKTAAQIFFEEPPAQVSGKGGSTRDVVSGYGGSSADRILGMLKDDTERATMIATHARWDAARSAYIMHWLMLAAPSADFPQILAERLAQNPNEVATLRIEQDTTKAEAHEAVCARHRQLATSAPGDAGLQYVSTRCITDAATREALYQQYSQQWPQDGWLAQAAGYKLAEHGQFREALAQLEVAQRSEPAVTDYVALDVARLRRLLGDGKSVNLTDLSRVSESLRYVLALETGTELGNSPLRAYTELGQGHIDQAIAIAKAEPRLHARLLRMAAASDGASPKLVEQALALPLNAETDNSTLWCALGLAAREKRDLAPLMAAYRQVEPKGAEAILQFLHMAQGAQDTIKAEAALDGLAPQQRGQAYGLAVVALGDSAPAAWRANVKRLLFAPERPYFR